jgi:FtsH-binding integral membrane protein
MLRQGPISLFLHGVVEYIAAVLLIAAPFLFNFHAGAAKAVSIVAGVVLIVVAASTAGRTSLVDSLPLPVHVLLDYALALGLIASPFLFGYSSESAPTAFFIILGVAHLLITIGTRFRSEADQHG